MLLSHTSSHTEVYPSIQAYQGSQAVHDEVDPEELQHGQRHLTTSDSSNEDCDECDKVDGQLRTRGTAGMRLFR